jgi:hypothetical protein
VRSVKPTDASVLVVAEGDTEGARNYARGHIFEVFAGRLFNAFGYQDASWRNRNVTSNGIELDLKVSHKLSMKPAIVECKAYSSAIKIGPLTQFYGKFSALRRREPDLHAFMVVAPRLTAEANEFYESIRVDDPDFRALDANDIHESLVERQVIQPFVDDNYTDTTIIVSEHGVYSAAIELGEGARAARVVVRATGNLAVPDVVLDLTRETEFARGLEVADWRAAASSGTSLTRDASPEVEDFIAVVAGSSNNFEYQLPASPRFFVGRRDALRQAGEVFSKSGSVLVLNAQSGWGKSSLALRLKKMVEDLGGAALVVDTRTVATTRFVSSVLRKFGEQAARDGFVTLSDRPSWASLVSSLRTLSESAWRDRGPLFLMFDQFENVFRDEALTRQFRDLALGVQELDIPLTIGFSWKTDYVGWTEGYPYQLRDEIRGAAHVISLPTWGPRDVETLLRRLEKESGQRLSRELRQRLREYSQGLPWLFKKLAGHLLREIESGITQEQLLSEALNVQSLFEADLAELTPHEREALKYIARFAPVNVTDAMDRVSADVVQSLINRRLVVSVGEHLDTYWDIFRDFVTSGRVPIEDSYILRQAPVSVARLLRELEKDGGDSYVVEVAKRFGTSENAVWNLVRELRLMGVSSYEPNRVSFVDAVRNADDREAAIRSLVGQALKRHRAYSSFLEAAERSGGRLTFEAFARKLQDVFPAVAVSRDTWVSYARVFTYWFEVGGLAVIEGKAARVATEGYVPHIELLSRVSKMKTRGAFPTTSPGPCVKLLLTMELEPRDVATLSRRELISLRDLVRLGVVVERQDGLLEPTRSNLFQDGEVNKGVLQEMLRRMPGGDAAWLHLQDDPGSPPRSIGECIKRALSADWSDAMTISVGKHFRGWVRYAGLSTTLRRKPAKHDAGTDGGLF